jgi:hypothetical protein
MIALLARKLAWSKAGFVSANDEERLKAEVG